jgi:hypothetical protein
MHPLPLASTAHNSHTLSLGDGKEYDVYRLIQYAQGVTPIEMRTAFLKTKLLSEECWTDVNERRFSPLALLTAYTTHRSWDETMKHHPAWCEHIEKTKKADYRFPILMYQDEVIDGTHRIIRASTENIAALPVRVLSVLPHETLLVPGTF